MEAVQIFAKVKMQNGKFSTEQFSIEKNGDEKVRVWEKLSNRYIRVDDILSVKQIKRIRSLARQKVVKEKTTNKQSFSAK